MRAYFDTGFLHDPCFTPFPWSPGEAITEADKAEFKIIKKMPVYDPGTHKAYASISSYITHRTNYFGPAYAAFAAESDAELANTKWVRKKHTQTLRSLLEFGKNTQQQQIFYRWVRKAYKLKFEKDGQTVDVPELIRRGMSQKLADTIAEVRGSIRVKKIHDENFKAGGFNPRPVKYKDHYLLGTLSEHATGMAVDIDDKQNPQLTVDEWKFIEGLAGKQVTRSGRWKTEGQAEGLWKDIDELSGLFVKKVAAEVRRVEAERAQKLAKEKADKEALKDKAAPKSESSAAKPKKPVLALEEVLGKNYDRLSPWVTKGFFHLPLELVLELHFHGFTWGATFSTNVDLHHFQLDE